MEDKRKELFRLFKNSLREKNTAIEFITVDEGLCIFVDGETFVVSIEATTLSASPKEKPL